ncbi:hypothetical protein A2982_00515 [candidate division WWE3 bacterium RIFCSPLOWO2_01_FULL_39_13]|uniref:PIN domain-containing protein n=1 Tax=candidate division WWE3 bacterium RIFCSPLOWO2_01_FULL_39_13 TaxID=1802624 RepID=A0A1F4V3K7_UNCKA|nr:MAG: hypothetical protein A2982_00515 [candidate division WWE3 bacterium RIFCSPLOWO2_01_FULL_39_13]
MKTLLDSNILIYSLNEDSELHDRSIEYLRKHDSYITLQNVSETYRSITSEKLFSNPFSPRNAIKAIDQIIKILPVLYPSEETYQILKKLIAKYKIKSYAVFDALIVAMMIEYNVDQIATNNDSHFRKYKEVSTLNPFK